MCKFMQTSYRLKADKCKLVKDYLVQKPPRSSLPFLVCIFCALIIIYFDVTAAGETSSEADKQFAEI